MGTPLPPRPHRRRPTKLGTAWLGGRCRCAHGCHHRDHAHAADPPGAHRNGAQAVRADVRALRTVGVAELRPQRCAAHEQSQRALAGSPDVGDQRRRPLGESRLVARSPHPTDGRTTLIELTAEGRTLAKKATAALNAEVFGKSGFGPDDVDHLIRVLGTFRRDAGGLHGGIGRQRAFYVLEGRCPGRGGAFD